MHLCETISVLGTFMLCGNKTEFLYLTKINQFYKIFEKKGKCMLNY